MLFRSLISRVLFFNYLRYFLDFSSFIMTLFCKEQVQYIVWNCQVPILIWCYQPTSFRSFSSIHQSHLCIVYTNCSISFSCIKISFDFITYPVKSMFTVVALCLQEIFLMLKWFLSYICPFLHACLFPVYYLPSLQFDFSYFSVSHGISGCNAEIIVSGGMTMPQLITPRERIPRQNLSIQLNRIT